MLNQAFAGDRLHPIVLLARCRLGTEIRVYRAIGVRLHTLVLAADAWELLGAVDDHRPEGLYWEVRRQVQRDHSRSVFAHWLILTPGADLAARAGSSTS
jgi:hypothetical protein